MGDRLFCVMVKWRIRVRIVRIIAKFDRIFEGTFENWCHLDVTRLVDQTPCAAIDRGPLIIDIIWTMRDKWFASEDLRYGTWLNHSSYPVSLDRFGVFLWESCVQTVREHRYDVFSNTVGPSVARLLVSLSRVKIQTFLTFDSLIVKYRKSRHVCPKNVMYNRLLLSKRTLEVACENGNV